MNKKGQFFLIGAVVIIGILIGFSTTYNSSLISREDKQPQYLAEEIIRENYNTINYALKNNFNQTKIDYLVENLTYAFSLLNPNMNIVIIYGNESLVKSQLYKNQNKIILKNNIMVNSNSTGIYLLYSNHTYSFNLKKGQNIHTIVKKEINDENIIYSK